MSGFGAGQFDDADSSSIERRIQEELRARQASAAASRVTGALGFGSRPRTTADQAFMSSLIAESAAGSGASPYYAQRAAAQAHASPFARPYATLGQQQAAASAYGVGHSPNDAVAASLYARQRAQQYGYASSAATPAEQRFHGYGVPTTSHELYSQHFGRSAPEMSLPLIDRAAVDRAAAYNAQQRQAEQQNAALLQQAAAAKSPTATISASTLSYMQKGTPKISSPTVKPPARQPTPQQQTPSQIQSQHQQFSTIRLWKESRSTR